MKRLPCPFCGSATLVSSKHINELIDVGPNSAGEPIPQPSIAVLVLGITCDDCNLEFWGNKDEELEELVARWNDRYDPHLG